MTRLGRAELLGLDHLSTDEQVARFEQTTPDDIAEVAAEVLGGPLVLGAVGPFSEDDLAEHVA
jgi:predicted Zn-dependent peptidase